MAAVHKISADFYNDSFTLIAIHSSLEDYAMVYAINQELKSNFSRFSSDLDLSEYESFPYFEWKNEMTNTYWTLIVNHSVKNEYLATIDLFQDEPAFRRHYLLPEYKDVDYFLKIDEEDVQEVDEIVKNLFLIPKVQTAYELETDKLKSKSNLIF